MNRTPPPSGFSLVELLAVLAILGIMLAVAMPSFTELIERERARSAATDLIIALSRTRSEAIKRNTNVALSPKSGNWANGWEVPDPATGTIIEDHGAVPAMVISGPATVVYQSSGRIQGGATPNFAISGNFAGSARCVTADLSGRPRSC